MRVGDFYGKLEYAYKLIKKIGYLPSWSQYGDDFSFFFPDGANVRNFIDTQRCYLNKGKLNEKEKELFLKYLKLEENLRNIKFNVKFNELCDMVSQIGYIPKDLKFSNGEEVITFIRYNKNKLKNNELSNIDKNSFELFLNYYDITNIRLRELEEAIVSLGTFPVSNTKASNIKKVKKFSDGVDMGGYIGGTLKDKIKKGELTEEQMEKVNELYNKYNQFNYRMNELKEICGKLGSLPTSDRIDSNKEKVFKFSDGVDVGSYIITMSKKIENDKLSSQEAKIFLEIIKPYKKLSFREKIKEAINYSIELGRVPIYNQRAKEHPKFSDGMLLDNFVTNYKRKLLNGKISGEKKQLFEELFCLNFDEINEWKQKYTELKNYYQTHAHLGYLSDDLSHINSFLIDQQKKYYYEKDKSIVQEVLNDKLFELDPFWIYYGRDKHKTTAKVIVKK